MRPIFQRPFPSYFLSEPVSGDKVFLLSCKLSTELRNLYVPYLYHIYIYHIYTIFIPYGGRRNKTVYLGKIE